MKKLFVTLLIISLLGTSLTGCSKSSASEEASAPAPSDGAESADPEGDLIPFKAAFCTWAGYAPLFIAKENGYFAEKGYDCDIIIMEDESTYGAAFVSDSIQMLGQVMDRDIIQYGAGAPEQYVCTMDCSTGGDGLVATADIQSVDDLAGKTVALDKSATSYFFFLQVLADSNITEDQINIVEMGNDEAGQAFIAGQVDAAITWEPALGNCGEREGGHILVSSADYPKAIIDVLTVSSTFAGKHPDFYEVAEECWYQAVDYLNENFDEGCAIMAKGLDLEVEDVKAECSGITFYGREENAAFNDLSTEDNVKDIAQMAAGFWVEKGLMENDDLTGFFPTLEADE
ncbi:MAG TPA: taurine ABC transporter substrate-binding protein [Lachnospiraceae bacterium]|nr:taurine ABC transporter substrate-binding protein [Lachnospiraceae bacterium]